MKEQLISFETAKLAKEKGFEWNVTQHYRNGNNYDKELINGGAPYNMNSKEEQELWSVDLFSAPTQSLLQKWLREEHNIEVEPYRTIKCTTGEKYGCQGEKWIDNESSEDLFNIYKDTYEEALEVGLQEALKLIEDENFK